MQIPHFISIGHITHDLIGNGITPGGPALYATCTARNLGAPAGMVTSFQPPFLLPFLVHGIEIRCKAAPQTTTFANLYNERGERRQIIESVAAPLDLAAIPETWRAAHIVNFCPVANEYPPALVRAFDQALIGVCPQGWMRKWNAQGHVSRKAWDSYADVLPYADVVFFSEEDVTAPENVAATYLAYTQMAVITRGKRGASVYVGKDAYHVPAFPANEIDPTGAGDVFATAFLLNYFDTRDPLAAATFANCVASFVVEKEGIYGIPSRADVEHRLKVRKHSIIT